MKLLVNLLFVVTFTAHITSCNPIPSNKDLVNVVSHSTVSKEIVDAANELSRRCNAGKVKAINIQGVTQTIMQAHQRFPERVILPN